MTYRKNRFLISLIFSLFILSYWANAQTLEEWKRQQSKELQKFKNQMQGNLNDHKTQQQEQLNEFIKIEKNWNKVTTGKSDFLPRNNPEEKNTNPPESPKPTDDLKKGEVSKNPPTQLGKVKKKQAAC